MALHGLENQVTLAHSLLRDAAGSSKDVQEQLNTRDVTQEVEISTGLQRACNVVEQCHVNGYVESTHQQKSDHAFHVYASHRRNTSTWHTHIWLKAR